MHLGEARSRPREQRVQRPWGGNMLAVFEGLPRGHRGCAEGTEEEVRKGKGWELITRGACTSL